MTTGAHRGEERASGTRTPEELREDLGELRAELGETVEELAYRADVPARLRERRTEVTQRVQQQVATTRRVIADNAPAVQSTLRENPALVSGLAAALAFLLLGMMRKRRKRRKDRDGTR
jgi:ElaB/YqjD/DUF883 family membrane-anchored ribosome-binding protein